MAKTKRIVEHSGIEDIVTKAVIAAISATKPPQPEQPPRRPFFNVKSPGMWASFGAIAVYAFTIFGNVNGCFQTKFTKDQKLESAYELSQALSQGDTAILKQITRNYWYFYGLHARDSIQDAQFMSTVMDSFRIVRTDLDYLHKGMKAPNIIFRGR